MDLSTIYANGIQIVTSSPNYDPTKPQKRWVRPIQPGEDPTDDFVNQTAELDNSFPPDFVKWHTKSMTFGEAAVANLPPTGFTGPEASGSVPIPMDQSKIPVGYKLSAAGQIGGFSLVPIAAPGAPATGDATEQRILKGEEEILDKLGLPEV